MEFVKIQPGEFMMGCSNGDSDCSDSEKPAHRVRITKGFEMGKYEVTQAQWEAAMGSNPSLIKGVDRPVETVSWNDVQEFLGRMNARRDGYRYRLPTEAEWEYAARAGTNGAFAGSLDAMAWYKSNSVTQTHSVGQKQANAWGLYDMHGNVAEWVQDWYDATYYAGSPQADPAGPTAGQYRAVRGGSWMYDAKVARVSSRSNNVPTIHYIGFGFRCVREAIR
jgi:formylglycine-generating enzyme required for sulfatase activity